MYDNSMSSDYTTLQNELNETMEKLQSAEVIDIEEAVKMYERGMQIIEELKSHLKTAENKVAKIKADFS